MIWLEKIRKKKGLSGREVAQAAKVSQQFYWMVEKGQRRPSVDVAKRIAAVLGFAWTRFFEEVDV